HLERHQISEQVEFEDRTEQDLLWHLCGPHLPDRFEKLLGSAFPSLGPWQHLSMPALLSERMQGADFVGLTGMFLTVPRLFVYSFQGILSVLGLPVGHFNDRAWTMLRIEAGTPAY